VFKSAQFAALVGAVATCLFPGCSAPPRPEPLILATTTSVGNSGLLDVLLPAFESDTAIRVRAHLVGSGQSLAMLERGRADVAISHAPEREADLRRAHPSWLAEPFMHNEFVIVGPLEDPAGVTGAPTAAEAMRRIATHRGARFVSRGDSSGTHDRERHLWASAGAHPADQDVIISGQGMAATLRVAGAMSAYTVTDRSTWAALHPAVELRELFAGTEALRNVYTVHVPRDERGRARRAEAEIFGRWLTQRRARQLIEQFTVRGARVFAVEAGAVRPQGQQDNRVRIDRDMRLSKAG
jgi:tungstate transport system substrate-binding protein